jgi:hypothetical protein
MSCSIEDSTSRPLSDFKNEGRPGVKVTVGPGMIADMFYAFFVLESMSQLYPQ